MRRMGMAAAAALVWLSAGVYLAAAQQGDDPQQDENKQIDPAKEKKAADSLGKAPQDAPKSAEPAAPPDETIRDRSQDRRDERKERREDFRDPLRPGPADPDDRRDLQNEEPRTFGEDEESPRADRPVLGVMIQDSPQGNLVVSVAPGGPAAEAGVRAGDVIVRVNGQRYGSVRELLAALAEMRDGDRPRLEVFRDGFLVRPFVQLAARDRVFGAERRAERRERLADRLEGRDDRLDERRTLRPLRGEDEERLRERIRQLETENAMLRKQLDELRGTASPQANDKGDEDAAEGDRAKDAPGSLPIPLPPKDADDDAPGKENPDDEPPAKEQPDEA